MAAQGQGVPLLHRLETALHLHGEELADHGQGLGVADDGGLRVAAQHLAQGGGMVRLHVVDHNVVQFPALEGIFQVFKEPLRNGLVHRVQQGRFFVPDQIGVIGNAPGNGVHIFKQGQAAVGASQPDKVGCDLLRAVHISSSCVQMRIFSAPIFYLIFPKMSSTPGQQNPAFRGYIVYTPGSRGPPIPFSQQFPARSSSCLMSHSFWLRST